MARYVCPGCSREVEASPFRTTCPTCGGRLVNRQRTGQ